jgi:hypothetical protein
MSTRRLPKLPPIGHQKSLLRIGYDGNAPEFREARDIAGKGKRKSELGPQNIRVDRLEWLLAHKRIDVAQHSAGRKLQHDTELAQIGSYATLENVKCGSGSGTNRLPDVKCDAIARVNAAHRHMGHKGWRILELVVIENVSLEKGAAMMRIHPRGALPALQGALDALAAHYKLA